MTTQCQALCDTLTTRINEKVKDFEAGKAGYWSSVRFLGWYPLFKLTNQYTDEHIALLRPLQDELEYLFHTDLTWNLGLKPYIFGQLTSGEYFFLSPTQYVTDDVLDNLKHQVPGSLATRPSEVQILDEKRRLFSDLLGEFDEIRGQCEYRYDPETGRHRVMEK